MWHSQLIFTATAVLFFTTSCSISNAKNLATHPEYINCKLPGAENTTVVFEDSTWQQCINQKLEIVFCIADIIDGEYNCVRHERVFQTMMESAGTWRYYFVRQYYLEGSGETLVNCQTLRNDYPDRLHGSAYKLKCAENVSDTSVVPGQDQDQLCLMKHHPVIYIIGSNVMFCHDKQFQIDKCLIKVDDALKCVSKTKFDDVESDELYADEFCDNFAKDPGSYLSNYMDHVTDCNAQETVVTEAPTTTTRGTTTTTTAAATTTTTTTTSTTTRRTTPTTTTSTTTTTARLFTAPATTDASTEIYTYEPYTTEEIDSYGPYPTEDTITPTEYPFVRPVFTNRAGVPYPNGVENARRYRITNGQRGRPETFVPMMTPQFINCNPYYAENTVVINAFSDWYQCQNGQLELKKCITNYQGWENYCFDYREMENIFARSLRTPGNEFLLDYYVDRRPENPLYCGPAVEYIRQNMNSHDIQERVCGNEITYIDADDYEDGDDLCFMEKPGFRFIGNRFYACLGDRLIWTKCMIRITNVEYKCLPLPAVINLLQAELIPSSYDEQCDLFEENYESLKHHFRIPLRDCNDPTPIDMDVKPFEQITSTSTTTAPTTTTAAAPTTTTAAATTTTTEARVTQEEVTPSVTANRRTPPRGRPNRPRLTLRPVVVTTEPPVVEPKICELKDPKMNGKCIHLEEFIKKFDNQSFGELHEQVDYGKLTTDLYTFATDMQSWTLEEFFNNYHKAKHSIARSPTQTLFNLAKLLKKDSTNCMILSDHIFVNENAVQDLLKDCPDDRY